MFSEAAPLPEPLMAAAMLEAPAPAPTSAPTPAPTPATPQSTIQSQAKAKASSKALAADAMRRAVEGFVARLPGRVDDLVSLREARELDKLRTLIHQLKGSGSGYGFPAITHCAGRTEALIKSDAEFDSVRTAVDELIALMRGTAGYDPGLERQSIADKK